ncbi:MAG: hypothetical protein ACM359_04635, partial [Bacillota bacterium]
DGESTLDLTDNSMIIAGAASDPQQMLDQVAAQIRSARGADGQWLGKGLTSSVAQVNPQMGLALMLNEKDGKPVFSTFAGQPVTENDILVKYTWNGDVNLDGMVDGDDYFLVDGGFISQLHGYQNGDVNFDGVVDGDDYFLIDSAFITQTGVPVARKASATQPLFSTKPVLDASSSVLSCS